MATVKRMVRKVKVAATTEKMVAMLKLEDLVGLKLRDPMGFALVLHLKVQYEALASF